MNGPPLRRTGPWLYPGDALPLRPSYHTGFVEVRGGAEGEAEEAAEGGEEGGEGEAEGVGEVEGAKGEEGRWGRDPERLAFTLLVPMTPFVTSRDLYSRAGRRRRRCMTITTAQSSKT